jgi:hypothetical protein
MNMKTCYFSACLLVLVGAQAASAAINVSVSSDAQALTDVLLGTGISVSNLTYTGASTSAGTFTGGLSAGIGIDQGIILTSGNAMLALGPNNSDSSGQSNNLAGDSDLDTLIPGYETHDATVLEFDFVTNSSSVYFNYVFASEEYNEYTNTAFNDVFGFFVDGVNIAKLPDGVTNVSINTVNGGNPYGTNASNPQWFINNDLNDGGPFYDIEYDGFTVKFLASITGLTAGTHRMKLAIADAGDWVLDSAVFIQAGTFGGDIPDDPGVGAVPEPASMAVWSLLAAVGLGYGLRRNRRK